ncbi:MAG: hypothetical protein ACI4JS_03315 [Oscillospiraceae bacterium]
MRFVREKKYPCRNGYMEVDMYLNTDTNVHKLPRAKREKISLPKQKKLNIENSRRAMRLLFNHNFKSGDYYITPTYSTEFLPENDKEAQNALNAYIRKLRTLYRRYGHELKYLYVTEKGTKKGRVHHHIIVNNVGISRDDIENLWSFGRANTKRLQPDPDGSFNSLAEYLMKTAENAEKYSRTWNCSRNLSRPEEHTNDNSISGKKFRSLIEAKRNDEFKIAVERLYKEHNFIDGYVSVNGITGLPYVKLRLMKKGRQHSMLT